MANARDEAQVSPSVEQVELLISREELISCSLPVWYEQFKNITFKSVFLPLPQEFIDYLNSDGCILPRGCDLPSFSHTTTHTVSDDDSDQVDWSDSEEETEGEKPPPSFPKLIEDISAAIQHLVGAVFPKLNWSSPRDAVWIAPGHTLKCTTPAEIFLLLKSSDFIAHDLTRASEYCKMEASLESPHHIKYTLCLRKWVDILPSMEFRCFVCKECLVAISQRNNSTFYQFLHDNTDRIKTEISSFFQREISGKFPNTNYIFDVVREVEDKFLLVDFNPYCPMTDSLLFSWEELTSDEFLSQTNDVTLNNYHPVFRLVDNVSIQPSDLQSLKLPLDVMDITTGMDVHKFVDLLQAKNVISGENNED